MSEPPNDADAEAEAADWFARLGTRAVSASTLESFAAWRSRPANAVAYRRLEGVWADAGDLRGDPDIRKVLAATTGPRRERPGWLGRPALAGGALCGVFACLVLGVSLWRQGQGAVSTEVGEQRVVRLEDGSTVRLNTDSRLRIRFADARRSVALDRGEALFTVAPDPSRPFVVDAGGTDVTAVGTAFAVRLDGERVAVTLLSGKVEVVTDRPPAGSSERRETRLAPGEQHVVSPSGGSTRQVDVAAQTSWAEGRLIFRDTPLDAAVEEVNRYLTAPIRLDAAGVETVAVNGVFQTGDRDAFVSAASDLFDLRGVPSSDGSVTLTERNKSTRSPGSPRG